MLYEVITDLRTVLTRFKLELALIGDSPEVEAMRRDVDEMARMLEAYLAFARGDLGEQSASVDMADFLEEFVITSYSIHYTKLYDIDRAHVRPDAPIKGAGEIAFFPPMTGG